MEYFYNEIARGVGVGRGPESFISNCHNSFIFCLMDMYVIVVNGGGLAESKSERIFEIGHAVQKL